MNSQATVKLSDIANEGVFKIGSFEFIKITERNKICLK